MKKIIITLLIMILVTNSQANLSKDIECAAIYVGLAAGLKKQGKHELSQKIQIAAKIRGQKIIAVIGKEKAHDKVMYSMKTIRQKYTDQEFNTLSRECIKIDGI